MTHRELARAIADRAQQRRQVNHRRLAAQDVRREDDARVSRVIVLSTSR